MNLPAERASAAPIDQSEDIRRFYLEPDEFYSLADLAKVWRVPLDDVCLMFSDELARAAGDADVGSFRVSWANALGAATVFHVFRAVDIERALGDDFDRVRSDRWRTVRIEVHIPRFVADAIAKMPLVPSPHSLAARVERFLCEQAEAECLTAAAFGEPPN